MMTNQEMTGNNLYTFCFLVLLTACKSEPGKNPDPVTAIVPGDNRVFLQEFYPESKTDQNEDIVKISYTQPDFVFYLFEDEELTFVEYPSGTFNHVNLDFFYNLSLEQAEKEIYFFGKQAAEWVAFPATTEEVFAYELYKIDQNELEPSGYYSPADFDFDFNDFKNKKVLVSEENNQYLIYLVGKTDTIICKKTSEIDLTEVLDQELINEIKKFEPVGNN